MVAQEISAHRIIIPDDIKIALNYQHNRSQNAIRKSTATSQVKAIELMWHVGPLNKRQKNRGCHKNDEAGSGPRVTKHRCH